MSIMARRISTLLLVLVSVVVLAAQTRPAGTPHRQLLVIFDGLRPDYVTPDVMPNLYALGQRGVVFANHHSVFPTVTRVNASSFSTGSYPERHGLLGNTVFFPQVDATRFLDTSDRENLVKIDAATGQHLLTNATLGETLQAAGKKMMVVSAGSTGSALLLNHKLSGGAVFHYEHEALSTPGQSLAAAIPPPAKTAGSDVLNHWAVDTFLKGMTTIEPAVAVLWLTDPDTTAHEKGIGDPATVECLRKADAEFKRALDGLAAAGRLDDFNVIVTSDHGFTTHTGAAPIADLLKPYARAMPDGSPRVLTGGDGAIYVRDHNDADIRAIVAALQKTRGAGAIFTAGAPGGGLFAGRIPGTLSFDLIRWKHERSADIIVSPDWTDDANAHGFKGTVSAGGVAGHGSTSRYDVHNTLIAAGPDIRRSVTIAAPSANVDIAPTLLTLAGVPVPASMQGRVLREATTSGPAPASITVRTEEQTVKTADGSYSATASTSSIDTAAGRFWYFDWAKATRAN